MACGYRLQADRIAGTGIKPGGEDRGGDFRETYYIKPYSFRSGVMALVIWPAAIACRLTELPARVSSQGVEDRGGDFGETYYIEPYSCRSGVMALAPGANPECQEMLLIIIQL
jgi:hypothetical protein